MTTEYHQIEVRGTPVEVVRKDIRNLHVGVYPPNGRIRIAAPLRLDDEAVRLAVISRLGWIRREQLKFDRQERQSQREFVTGESHYFGGLRYRLNVIEHDGSPSIRLPDNTTMELRVPRGADRSRREIVLQQWYRQQLRERIPPLLTKWEPKVGIAVAEVRIRKMKTRWGSCNTEARRIWLNQELAKKPPSCLEYILVHEMTHLIERRHNEHFRDLMDTLMPSWYLYREALNRTPLVHEVWGHEAEDVEKL
ncbi:MAG: M48 family metallopeptidase [Gammaproteobacteria bacterium]|nr:M48 family metallopeptidase [Gammaproteobacteria bacterium]NNJ84738.1 M48 family metallopeptidase [Gammaproteobacteria bacterium]